MVFTDKVNKYILRIHIGTDKIDIQQYKHHGSGVSREADVTIGPCSHLQPQQLEHQVDRRLQHHLQHPSQPGKNKKE